MTLILVLVLVLVLVALNAKPYRKGCPAISVTDPRPAPNFASRFYIYIVVKGGKIDTDLPA